MAELDLSGRDGVHPRLGLVDVVPFVALGEPPVGAPSTPRREFGARIAAELEVPVFLYGDADPGVVICPRCVATRSPAGRRTSGRPTSSPWGATAVGRPAAPRRRELLRSTGTTWTSPARIATAVRAARWRPARGSGPRVPAALLGRVQVSMNVTDLTATSVEAACDAVAAAAQSAGAAVTRVEWSG